MNQNSALPDNIIVSYEKYDTYSDMRIFQSVFPKPISQPDLRRMIIALLNDAYISGFENGLVIGSKWEMYIMNNDVLTEIRELRKELNDKIDKKYKELNDRLFEMNTTLTEVKTQTSVETRTKERKEDRIFNAKVLAVSIVVVSIVTFIIGKFC